MSSYAPHDSPDNASDLPKKPAIHLTIPPRSYLLPGAAIVVGTMIGLRRGARTASLQFLAENAHRPPTTVQGWYFYNKTKNYRVLMSGLKEAGKEATKLGATAAVWVALEEGCARLGERWADASEVVAGVGTAGVFSGVYQLPWKAARRALVLGVMVGAVLRGLRWSQNNLRERAQGRVINVEGAAAEGQTEERPAVSSEVDKWRTS